MEMSQDCVSRYFFKRIFSEELIFQHITERYGLMAENINAMKQDLGIIDDKKNKLTIEIDYEENSKEEKKGRNKRKKGKEAGNLKNFTIELEQLPTSLKSNINGNSTTGFVVWQSTTFFLNWLLKDGGKEFLKWDSQTNFDVLELGTGVNCSNSVVLSNFTRNFYISTDQKGILPKLKTNCLNNLCEIKRYQTTAKNSNSGAENDPTIQQFRSDSLNINSTIESKEEIHVFRYEVLQLDWCANSTQIEFEKISDLIKGHRSDCLSILAVDVIYNEFLILPFIETTVRLLKLRPVSEAIVVLQLRDESIIIEFLSECLNFFKVDVIEDKDIETGFFSTSRHAIYKLTLI